MRLTPDRIGGGPDRRSVDQELDVADSARVHGIRFQGAAADDACRSKIPDPRRRAVAGRVGEGSPVACEDHVSAGQGGLALRELRCGVAGALGELGGADLARVAGSQYLLRPVGEYGEDEIVRQRRRRGAEILERGGAVLGPQAQVGVE
jgi:hypothetical protein